MNEKRKKWSILLLVILIVITLGCIIVGVKAYMNNRITSSPAYGEMVSLLEDDIYTVSSSYTKGITDRYFTKEDCFAPKDVIISWDCAEEGATSYILKIGTKEDLSDAQSYETSERSFTLNTLYAGTHYYYQIEAVWFNKTIQSKVFDFVTEDLPRTISIDGVSNTRDIGGYVTEDGKHRVRQGIVYRGAAVDNITTVGKETLMETCGVKTDLDLRGTLERSPLGGTVNFVNVSAPHYAKRASEYAIYKSAYQEALVTAIRTFADEDNYPIFMHCQIGRDRTGTLAFLINALLGVGENDLYLDYELSFMSQSGCNDFVDGVTPSTFLSNHFWSLYSYIDNYVDEGTLSDKVEAFMLDIGMTEEELASIRTIMLEDNID